jgi:hypothetical protein
MNLKMRSLTLCWILAASTLAGAAPDLTGQIGALEWQFYEDWKGKSLAAFEKNLAPDSIAWGEYGAFDKKQQIEMQKGAEAHCEVRGFSLTNLATRRIAKDTVVLTYRVDQDALCGGHAVPTPLTNASVYVRRQGRWLNVFRAGLPVKELPRN